MKIYLKFLSFFLLLFLLNACQEDSAQISTNDTKGAELNSKKFYQSFLDYKSGKASSRTGVSYTIDEFIEITNDAVNYNHSFAHLPAGPLVPFIDSIILPSTNISETEGNVILNEILCVLKDRYLSLENPNANLVQFALIRESNALANGGFQTSINSFFITAPQQISNVSIAGTCTGEGPFCMDVYYRDFNGTCMGNAAKQLEQQINNKLRDPNPRVYYTNVEYTCARPPSGNICSNKTIFYHDVINYDDPILGDNRTDYRVFHVDGLNYQDWTCIPYPDLNCYYAWAFVPISKQHNPPNKVFHMVEINPWLLPGLPGVAGHTMQFVYGEKKTRFIGDTPAKFDQVNCL